MTSEVFVIVALIVNWRICGGFIRGSEWTNINKNSLSHNIMVFQKTEREKYLRKIRIPFSLDILCLGLTYEHMPNY